MSFQQIIPLEFRKADGRQDFVVGDSNIQAVKWIDRYPEWDNNGLILIGPKASGKSHLVAVLKSNKKFKILKLEDIDPLKINKYHNENIIIENLENIKNFKNLLHIINFVKENKYNILITSRNKISDLNINLKDLSSRLLSFQQATILHPTDDVLSGLIFKLLKDKGINVERKMINFIILRIERTYQAANNIVNLINQKSLEQKKNITIPMIKNILEKSLYKKED